MPYVPPWLSVQPSDFIQAANSGARIGTQLREISQQAQTARERNAASMQENAMRVAAQASEAQSRLAQAAEQEKADSAMRQWEEQQRFGIQRDTLASEEERAKSTLGQRTQYEGGLLNLRDEANRIAQQRADAETSKAGQAKATIDPVDSRLLSDALIRRRSAQENIDKASIDPSAGGVSREMLLKLRAADADVSKITQKYSAPPATSTGTTQSPQEGQRVRQKSTGRTGTVTNGQIAWDDQAPQTPPAGQGNLYEGIPGAVPTSGGSMFMGRNLPVMSDVGAQ